MSRWNRRKKYSIEGEVEGKKSKIATEVSKLVKRELYLTMASIVGVSLIIIGSTYAVFSSVNRSKEYNVINVGTLEIEYDDTGSGLGDIIKLNNAFPVSDSTGQSNTPYKFKITNTGSIATEYSIRIADDEGMIEADGCSDNLLPKTALKYSLNGGAGTLLSSKTNYVIESGTLKAGESKTYNLRMWIHTNVGNEILGKHFHGKIVIESEATTVTNKDTILAGLGSSGSYETINYNWGGSVEETIFITGSSPNSWVKYNNQLYKIIEIEKSGNIKMYGTSTVTNVKTGVDWWTNMDNGINSMLNEYIYENVLNSNRDGMMVPSRVCVDKYSADTIPEEVTTCTNVVTLNVGLMSVSERSITGIGSGWLSNQTTDNLEQFYVNGNNIDTVSINSGTYLYPYPVITLKSEATITSGDGTQSNPYTFY